MPIDCEIRNGRLVEAGDEDPVNSQWEDSDKDDRGQWEYEQRRDEAAERRS